MTSEDYARMLKAVDLEQCIVEANDHETFLQTYGADPEVRRRALAALAKKRQKRVSASETTWRLVLRYLQDRYRRC